MVRVAMTGSGCGRGDPQCGIVTVLRQRVAVLETEDQRVRAERDQLAGQVERLEVGNQQLRARIGQLAWQVEELRRAGRRQAAPFSKDRPNPSPRRPGRKAGDAYGRRARRPVPDRVDWVVSVPLPAACPSCGGPIPFERVADQHQEDFPPPKATKITRFEVAIGRCWARPASRSARARSRWPPGATRGWGCRPARSPGCSASSALRSPRVG
jgi:hypothetical protein